MTTLAETPDRLGDQPRNSTYDRVEADRKCPYLLLTCSFIAAMGSLAMGIGNIWGSLVVPDHNWMSETISDLAAGRLERIQDFALYGYACSLIACAIGAAHFHTGNMRWTVGIFSLAVACFAVLIVAARNEYGDNDNEGVVIHIYLVYALGVLFTVIFGTMAKGMGDVAPWAGWVSIGCLILWAIGAPLFFLVPTSIDGIWERGIGLVTMIWVLTFAWVMSQVRLRYLNQI